MAALFSAQGAVETKNSGGENQYFTAAVIGSVILAVIAWAGVLFFEAPILRFFGADESLLVLAQKYMRPVKIVFPLFLFNQMLAAFFETTKIRSLQRWGCYLAAFLIFSAITSLYSSAIWESTVQVLPQP